MDKLEALIVSGAPTEEVKAQRDFVQSAIQANSVPLSQLQSAVQEDVEAANDAFTEAVEAIDEDAPLTETAPSYAAAIDAWNASIDDDRIRGGLLRSRAASSVRRCRRPAGSRSRQAAPA